MCRKQVGCNGGALSSIGADAPRSESRINLPIATSDKLTEREPRLLHIVQPNHIPNSSHHLERRSMDYTLTNKMSPEQEENG